MSAGYNTLMSTIVGASRRHSCSRSCIIKIAMRSLFIRTLAVCLCVFAFAVLANAQERRDDAKKQSRHDDNVAVVIVKSAAKGTWAVTKFTAGKVVKPLAVHVGKSILFKFVPAVGKLALKATGVGAKTLLPYAAKLAVL